MINKSVGKLLFQGMLLMILLFGLVRLVMIKDGAIVAFEFLILAFLLLLSVVGLATYKNSGHKILFTVFLFYTVNLLFLWYHYQSLYLTLFVASLIGLWISLPSKEREMTGKAAKPSVPPQKVVDGKVEPKTEAKEEPKTTEPKVEFKKEPVAKAKHIPGKYVASKRSNVYHEPKCDWAKKIQKDRRVWFASSEEALEKGYRKHGCVK